MFKEKFEDLGKFIISNKKNFLPLVISLLITLTFIFGIQYLGRNFVSYVWIVNIILFSLLLLIIMMVAGFAVLKSLFLVAAGFSFLIFLAQSYCETSNRLAPGDQALKSLLIIGILYIAVNFFKSLCGTVKGDYKKVKDEKWSPTKIFTVSTYILFTYLFVSQVYMVVAPIVSNLCIYK